MAAANEMLSNMDGVLEELAVLESIYITELTIEKDETGWPYTVSVLLHPATGMDESKKYVCITLDFLLPADYPENIPDIVVRNPRGLSEEEIHHLVQDMKTSAEERKGGPMLYELFELAKDRLTEGNIPNCECAICLENFGEGAKFIKTDCYHYFHLACLARYATTFLLACQNDESSQTPHAQAQTKEKTLGCPMCRLPLTCDLSALLAEPLPPEETISFKPSSHLIEQQQQMAALYQKQKGNGGIIDLQEEKNKFLVDENTIVSLHSVAQNQEGEETRSNPSFSTMPVKSSRPTDSRQRKARENQITTIDGSSPNGWHQNKHQFSGKDDGSKDYHVDKRNEYRDKRRGGRHSGKYLAYDRNNFGDNARNERNYGKYFRYARNNFRDNKDSFRDNTKDFRVDKTDIIKNEKGFTDKSVEKPKELKNSKNFTENFRDRKKDLRNTGKDESKSLDLYTREDIPRAAKPDTDIQDQSDCLRDHRKEQHYYSRSANQRRSQGKQADFQQAAREENYQQEKARKHSEEALRVEYHPTHRSIRQGRVADFPRQAGGSSYGINGDERREHSSEKRRHEVGPLSVRDNQNRKPAALRESIAACEKLTDLEQCNIAGNVISDRKMWEETEKQNDAISSNPQEASDQSVEAGNDDCVIQCQKPSDKFNQSVTCSRPANRNFFRRGGMRVGLSTRVRGPPFRSALDSSPIDVVDVFHPNAARECKLEKQKDSCKTDSTPKNMASKSKRSHENFSKNRDGGSIANADQPVENQNKFDCTMMRARQNSQHCHCPVSREECHCSKQQQSIVSIRGPPPGFSHKSSLGKPSLEDFSKSVNIRPPPGFDFA